MIRKKIDFYLNKNNISKFSITVFIIGALFFIGIIIFFALNSLHVRLLLKSHLTEFVFLLLTGYFLISFKYEILSIPISFNAFIIYMSYCILTEPQSNDILLVILFIVVYFVSVLIIYTATRTLTIYRIEQFFIRSILWTILIIVFNFILHSFKIDINTMRFKTILFIPLLIFIHAIIKISFSIVERFFKKRYGAMLQQTVTFIIIDSIFLFFSIILGTIYNKITMLHTAFFIAFLALIVSLTRYITRKYDESLRFYSLQSFITPEIGKKQNNIPFLPLHERILTKNIFGNKINYISFIIFFNIEKYELSIPQKITNLRFMKLNEYCISTIQFIEKEDKDQILNFNKKYFDKNTKVVYCNVHRKFWDFIDVSLIFKVLFKFINKFNSESDIKRVDQSFIFHKE